MLPQQPSNLLCALSALRAEAMVTLLVSHELRHAEQRCVLCLHWIAHGPPTMEAREPLPSHAMMLRGFWVQGEPLTLVHGTWLLSMCWTDMTRSMSSTASCARTSDARSRSAMPSTPATRLARRLR